MNLAARFDARAYARLAPQREAARAQWTADMRWLDLADGQRLRILDTDGQLPALLIVPDGPCIIEHYLPMVAQLRDSLRVICLDLPGFGMSAPGPDYRHRLQDGAQVLLNTLTALRLDTAAIAASCCNGYYAMAAARQMPDRIHHLFLSQTPSLADMRNWVQRIVPRPIRVPLLGQALAYTKRQQIAHGWYKVALADREQRAPFQQTAKRALDNGGCYCFASVVQGFSHCHADDLQGIETPVTALWGMKDRSHAGCAAHSIHAHLPQARITQAETAGHFPDLEAAPQFIAQILAELAPQH